MQVSARLSLLNNEAVEEVLHIQDLIENLCASKSKRKEKLGRSAQTEPLHRTGQNGSDVTNQRDHEKDDIVRQLEELEKFHRDRLFIPAIQI